MATNRCTDSCPGSLLIARRMGINGRRERGRDEVLDLQWQRGAGGGREYWIFSGREERGEGGSIGSSVAERSGGREGVLDLQRQRGAGGGMKYWIFSGREERGEGGSIGSSVAERSGGRDEVLDLQWQRGAGEGVLKDCSLRTMWETEQILSV